MATAYVSGVVALFVSYLKSKKRPYTNKQLMKILTDTATDYGASGFDVESGYGILNPINAFNRIQSL
jgi:hypothetical protein